MDPQAITRTFTMKELARRAEADGPRPDGASLASWLERLAAERRPAELLRDSMDDDVLDPVGGPRRTYRRAIREIETAIDRIVTLCWP